jgi:hypothetical protein
MKYLFSTFLILLVSFSLSAESYKEGMVGFSYPDNDSSDFLIKALDSLDKDYEEKEVSGRKTIFWTPKNKEEENEISNRVSQYIFIKTVCKDIPLPLPSEPAKNEISCSD